MPRATSSNGGITLHAVQDKLSLNRFIRVPWVILADDAHWVPPLMMERRDHLDRDKNPYFANVEARFWYAERDGRPVGRISAQVNRGHLARHNDAVGHFGFFDAVDDRDVVKTLVETAGGWLKEQGMRRMRGPFSLSINDESGVLVRGFDTPPSLMMPHGPRYYGARLEETGLAKAMDLIAYDYRADLEMPPGPRSLVKKLEHEPNVRLRRLDMSRFESDIAAVLGIFNDAWSDNWSFVPFTEDEVRYAAHNMKPLIDSDLVCIAEVDGEPAAMIVSLPNLNEAIADLNGRLLPFGWLRLLWRLKVSGLKSARVPLLGVRRKFHGTLLGSALAFGVIDRIRRAHLERGTEHVELSWILEENTPMRRMIDALGATAYKIYRIYEREIG